jgi:flavin-binding protein dodecin
LRDQRGKEDALDAPAGMPGQQKTFIPDKSENEGIQRILLRTRGTGWPHPSLDGEEATDSVYRVTEIVGTSTKSWEDAARNAVETASDSLRDLRVAEIVKMDLKVENGKVKAYRTRVNLSFKYEG